METNKIIGLGIIFVGLAGAIGYYVYSSRKIQQSSDSAFNTPKKPVNNPGLKKNNQGQQVQVSGAAVKSFGSEQYSSNPILNLRNR